MPHLSKNTKKYVRYALSGFLVTGMVLITGFLSFTGMLVLNDSLYLAIATFFLAGGIEGEVYAQNISASLLKIFTGGYFEDVVCDKKLAALIEDLDDEHPTSPFLTDYKNLMDYLSELEETHDDQNKQKIADVQRSLKWMRRYFKDFILQDATPITAPFHAELAGVVTQEEKVALRQQIRKKVLLSRLSWILNIGAGISCGLVGLEVAQSSIAILAAHFGLAISGTVMATSVFGLALLGAIGYVFMIHNTITNIIKNDTIRKWTRETIAFFARQEKIIDNKVVKDARGNICYESNLRYALRTIGGALGVGLVVSLGIFATVATAGTWWHAAKAGAKMLPVISKYASQVRTAAVSVMGVTQLIFNVVNSLKSVKEIVEISAYRSYKAAKANFDRYAAVEKSKLQLFNPFRLLINLVTVPFQLVVFIGHLFSMGIMGDKLDYVPPFLTTFFNIINEAIQDSHYFLPEKHHEHAHDAEHEHEHEHKHEHVHDHKHKHEHKHKHGHKHKHHDHSHADLSGKFLKFALAPLYLLGILWDFAAKNDHSRASFKQSAKKIFFGLPHENHAIREPSVSHTLKAYEKQARIEKALAKRAASIANPKEMEAIQELKGLLVSPALRKPVNPPIYLGEEGQLNMNLFFENKKLSKPAKAVCEKLVKIADAPQYQATR